MLDITQVDLSSLCEALEDHSYDHHWWFNPLTGAVDVWLEDSDEDQEELDQRGMILIEPISSDSSYRDLAEFTSQVRDPRARDLLERAISGRGAFRRFKDTLFDFPNLREAWFKFHDNRVEQRALGWLADNGFVGDEVVQRELGARSEFSHPELGGSFDAMRIATDVADELKTVYGDRLRQVLLFGSWARGDAHPESDIDLLVVLDEVLSPWQELRRMDDVAWRHSFENDTVITVLPVAEADLEDPAVPSLLRAKSEGQKVA